MCTPSLPSSLIHWPFDIVRVILVAIISLMPATFAVVLSERVVQNVKMCEIRSEIYGASDHCPVVMEIEDVI